MKKINRIKYVLAVMLTLFVLAVTMTGGMGVEAYAATTSYSSVIEDLTKDSEFNFTDYAESKDDYSIKVIQIAESVAGEVFLYTYQPCLPARKLEATTVNMSLTDSVDGTKLYDLRLLNTWGVFGKYLINGLSVSDSATRYYNISSIYRFWNNDLDGKPDSNNTGNYKAYPVGNIYRVTGENGNLQYSCEPIFTVQIIEPYSDYLVYVSSASLPSSSSIKFSFDKMGMIDAHYIAFSTDWEIDRLKSATVTYSYCTGSGYYNTFLGFDCGGDLTYGAEQSAYAYPTYADKFELTGNYWNTGRKYNYSWDRIQTVSEFISEEKNLTEETQKNLAGKQWVLRFLETQRTQTETGILGYKKYTTEFTKVDKVAVLRLEFESDGICYNLGAVSDIVSGDDIPGNAEEAQDGLTRFFVYIWNCIKKLFAGKANGWEKAVAIIAMVVALFVFAVAVWLIKKIFRMIFK